MANLGYLEWSCSDETVCASITEYHADRWNAITGTYERVRSVVGVPGPLYKASVRLTRGETTYFRITGVLADGTTAAVTHSSTALGDSL
ncbi:hypothetical protein ACWD5Q_12810 [Streptomyces sp. NPDC002513]